MKEIRTGVFRVKRKQWEPIAFASPSLILIALVIVFRLGYSCCLSLQSFAFLVGAEYEYVGAKSSVGALVKDQRFLGSVWNTAVIIAPSLALERLRPRNRVREGAVSVIDAPVLPGYDTEAHAASRAETPVIRGLTGSTRARTTCVTSAVTPGELERASPPSPPR